MGIAIAIGDTVATVPRGIRGRILDLVGPAVATGGVVAARTTELALRLSCAALMLEIGALLAFLVDFLPFPVGSLDT